MLRSSTAGGGGRHRGTIKRGLGTERAKLGIFRGLGTERARLGTLRGFGTERARLGTFRGFDTERARLGTLRDLVTERGRHALLIKIYTFRQFLKNLKKMSFFYSKRPPSPASVPLGINKNTSPKISAHEQKNIRRSQYEYVFFPHK